VNKEEVFRVRAGDYRIFPDRYSKVKPDSEGGRK